MKKIIFSIIISCSIYLAIAQQEYGNFDVYSEYQMDNINDSEFEDTRVRTSGTKGFQIMVLIPFDININADGIEVDSTIELNNQHRLTEYLVPNFKWYLDDKSDINFGLFYRGIGQKLIGEVDTSLSFTPLLKQEERKNGRGIYLRSAYNRHFSLQRFKEFDLDIYAGAALTLGFIPQREIDNEDYIGGNYNYITKKSRAFGFGLDGYGGLNFQFERFSAGIEILLLGIDYNAGFGKTKVFQETKIGNNVTTSEYYELDGQSNVYSSLKYTQQQTMMYRGVRLSFCYYFK